MGISRELFLSILAMDSYNRGYDPGIAGLGGKGTEIRGATFSDESDVDAGTTGRDASFYAAAYTINQDIGEGDSVLSSGTTVISYRGTDSVFFDALSGFPAGGGNATATQALMAAQFYRELSKGDGDTEDIFGANIEFTGHSLGGGLAV